MDTLAFRGEQRSSDINDATPSSHAEGLSNNDVGFGAKDVVGDPLSARVLCDPLSLFKTPNFIRTINGCSPDRFGQFQLTAGDHENPATVLRIYPRNGRIVVELAGGE
jgi:hypothetical protein